MTSVGVPFISAGDERGRSQKGNNNAYCQDNELSWIDWTQCDEDMLKFTRQIIALRQSTPELKRTTYFDGAFSPVSGMPDVAWLEGNGSLLCHDEWHDPSRTLFGALLAASSPMLYLFNRGDLPQSFVVPGSQDSHWQLVYDTSLSAAFPTEILPLISGASSLPLKAHSIVCLRLERGTLGLELAC
jgi:glycogen operon protein